jgi:hypothetical protein
MAIQQHIKPDPDHPCEICGGDAEIVSKTMTTVDDNPADELETPGTRRCADPSCGGHAGLDD